MESFISQIRKELRGLKVMEAFCTICEAEQLGSRATVYRAVTPTLFIESSLIHRAIIRRAVKFLQTQGACFDWDIETICPALPHTAAAA